MGDLGVSFSLKEVLTAVPIGISILALLYAWYKDRLLKKKEYSDRIRRAAGSVTAKLERWRELALRFFDDIQPLMTDADIMLTNDQTVLSTRDFLWRGLVTAHSDSSRRILDEQIEIAYVDLYGYDARIRVLFTTTITLLKDIDVRIFGKVLEETQDNVTRLKPTEGNIPSAMLGNSLRLTCAGLQAELATVIDRVLTSFRGEMMKLIEASDSEIFDKSVEISVPEESFQNIKASLEKPISERLKTLIESEMCALDPTLIVAIERKGTAFLSRTFNAGEQQADTNNN